MDKVPAADSTNDPSVFDDAEGKPEPHFNQQPDKSRGMEHLPQPKLEAS